MGMDWSELPQELLEIIACKLIKIYIDYVRFRAVCVKWRSSVASTPPHHLPTQLPWLLFSYSSDIETDRCFLDLSTNKFHHLNLMESRDSRCCGSSQGWLVFVEEFTPAIRLINPLTRNVIHLPPLTTLPNVLDFDISNLGNEYLIQPSPGSRPVKYSRTYIRDYLIKKVVLSSNPNSLENNYIALIIFKENAGLAFYKKGVEEWLLIKDAPNYYEDAIYYNGSFYTITEAGSISICNLSGVSPIVTLITKSPILRNGMVYLVDSFGELMLVNRYMDLVESEIDLDHDDEYDLDHYDDEYDLDHGVEYELVVRFSVFKYDSSKPEWVQMDTLGDHMLFLGANSSVCLSSSDFFGCERNCIYFSSDDKYLEIRYYEFGVYHLDDSSFEPLPNDDDSSQCIFHLPPIWVTPNPC